MDPQYNYFPASRQGPEVRYAPRYDYRESQIGTGGEPMTPMGSRSSDGSSGMSSTFSTSSWDHVQMPTTPMSITSPSDLEPNDSWTLESSYLRPTFKSLGWAGGELFNIYKFIVPKGQDPYFELLPGTRITPQTPAVIYLDPPANFPKNTFPCCHPLGCPKKKDEEPFHRAADLERHYKNVHGDLDQKETFYCDYGNKKCDRHNTPFTRKDHYRDHLKDYHKEDIGCAKRSKKMSETEWVKEQKKWEKDRKIYAKHWRCAGCLTKNFVTEDGWNCSYCKKLCEPERQAARDKLARDTESNKPLKNEPNPYPYAASVLARGCSTCSGPYPGYIDNGMGEWVVCPACEATASWASSSTSMGY